MLTETHTLLRHFYTDENKRRQGHFRSWHNNGVIQEESYFIDDRRCGECKAWTTTGALLLHSQMRNDKYHGEFKMFYASGCVLKHRFFITDIDITDDIKKVIDDINNITEQDRVIIKLKFGIDCLRETIAESLHD